MKNVILAAVAALALTACGPGYYTGDTGATGPQGPQGPAAPTPTVSDQQAQINSLVDAENANRTAQGIQYEIRSGGGLSCSLYTLTGGSCFSSSSAGCSSTTVLTGATLVRTWILNQSFNQANSAVTTGLNILPADLQQNPLYQNLIEVVCSGDLVVTQSAYYDFSLASDDGSMLYVAQDSTGYGNTNVINNDGNHGITTKTGSMFLKEGVHAFQLKFAQTGAGSQALILNANGSLIDPMYFAY